MLRLACFEMDQARVPTLLKLPDVLIETLLVCDVDPCLPFERTLQFLHIRLKYFGRFHILGHVVANLFKDLRLLFSNRHVYRLFGVTFTYFNFKLIKRI